MKKSVPFSNNLTAEHRMKVEQLAGHFQDIFAGNDEINDRTNVVTHRINTGDAKSVRQQPRRLPLAKREEAEKIIKEMAEQGIIEPSSSPCTSPVIMVKKKGGSTRFCVDCRQ